ILNYQSKVPEKLWPAGEQKARMRLRKFIKQNLNSYKQRRDFPAMAATSRLSPYLTAGMISPRECFLAAFNANHHQLASGSSGAVTWMNELIWREFYKNILAQNPRVSMGQAFQLRTEKMPWQEHPQLFQAWAKGRTGIPIVDAAMRQLNAIGWMHNRLRMIVASFLVKNLQLDWRVGEKYFMEHLIDGDLAANNGGWQWCASTGVDAVPYFRVFNPYTQSIRYDPEGELIREYCPELKKLTGRQIHRPPLSLLSKLSYPEPIIDVAASRRQFIAKYKKTVFNE
ncbi:MAG: deoxyribodipyrimidine photo-lyase, partial [Proteobacteria bacterium]|nr:deoxyribodipyrimidine photo-lyase [Pseudomonadota bacterium]